MHQPDDPGVRPGTRAPLPLSDRLYLLALLLIVSAGLWALVCEVTNV